jgi:monoamine oxidase
MLVDRMQPDLHASSGAPTYYAHNDADVLLDRTDLASYLADRAEGLPLIRAALDEAYVAEYGRECSEQSALNLLLFLHLDRRAKFAPFGIYSDERFHLTGGNDGIATGIRGRLRAPLETGMELTGLRRNAGGEYELRFRGVGTVRRADAVVIAIPFTVLRNVELDASLGLSTDKLRAIRELGYGDNAKTMIGFTARPWRAQGGNGAAYSDLEHHQTSWETNPSTATDSRAVLTDYAGGVRGAQLGRTKLQEEVAAWLDDADRIHPGARAAARPGPGGVLAVRQHWPSWPYSRGSYTCYLPGQFTTLADLESEAAGPLKFAGEHADSFYSWQGFMEGALLSGLRAAGEVLDDAFRGRI